MKRIKVTPNPVEQGKEVTIEVENATGDVVVQITTGNGTVPVTVPHNDHAKWTPPDGSTEARLNAAGCAEVHLIVLTEAAAEE